MSGKASFEKVKKWFSFSKLLHNDKLMMILSLLLAILVWVSVISGPANISERSIAVGVTVELPTGGYAYQSGLRIVSENEFVVKVNVSGPWSTLMKLEEADLNVKADLTAITGAGEVNLPIIVSRNSAVSDYEVLNVTPNTVTVTCDYWQEGTIFTVETDVSALTVADDTAQVGEPVLDKTSFPTGIVTIDGPKAVVGKIERIVARVTDDEPLTALKQYEVPLVGLDASGNELDLSDCAFREVPSGTVQVTVPLWESRHIEVGYTPVNYPSGIDPKDYLVAEPNSMDVYGTPSELDAFETQLGDLGTVDFSKLSLTNDTVEFPLTIPSTMRTVGGSSKVTVRLLTEGLSQKTVSFRATNENVVVSGNFNGYSVTVPTTQTTQSVLLVGNEKSIDAITSENVSLHVTMTGTPTAGVKSYVAQLRIEGYDDVWAYYGDATGLSVSLLLQ